VFTSAFSDCNCWFASYYFLSLPVRIARLSLSDRFTLQSCVSLDVCPSTACLIESIPVDSESAESHFPEVTFTSESVALLCFVSTFLIVSINYTSCFHLHGTSCRFSLFTFQFVGHGFVWFECFPFCPHFICSSPSSLLPLSSFALFCPARKARISFLYFDQTD
jgi:hypothetical protein